MMNTKSKLIAAACMTLWIATGASAVENNQKVYIEKNLAPLPVEHLPVLNAENLVPLKKHANELGSRKLASDLTPEEFEAKYLSPKLIEMRDKFLSIKTADGIRAYFTELDKNYDTYPDDLKYIAAQLLLLRPYDGIIYRLSPVFEGTKVTHATALSVVSGIASSMEVFFPTDQWESLFKYVTVPSDQTAKPFRDMIEYQNFLVGKVLPAMNTSVTRLNALAKNMSKSFVVDRKFLYGPANYASAEDRFRSIGAAEVYASLASLSFSMHDQYVFCAYDQEDLPKVLESIGKLYGRDAFLPESLVGVSASAKFEKIKSYKNFLVLRPVVRKTISPWKAKLFSAFVQVTTKEAATLEPGGYGKMAMARAFDQLTRAVAYTDTAWSSIQNESTDQTLALLKPAVAHAYGRQGDLRLGTWKGLVAGKMPVQSAVVPNEVVKVDLPSFYSNPVSDLKDLMPTGFDRSPAYDSVALTSGNVKYRNYFSGRPTEWNAAAYGRFLTTSDGRLGTDQVTDAMRTMRQAWGGKQVTWPLNFVVQ